MESPLPLPPKPTPHSPVPSPNTPVQYDRRPLQTTQSPSDICFRCRQAGHWIRDRPLNNKSRSRIAPNSNFPDIYCRCGHGFCEVRTARNDRSFYVCPINRGRKCRNFVKWCDEIDESDLCPPRYTYPMCSCGAGVCRRVKATSGPNNGRYFFACPIRQGHGACSYLVWEDTLSVIPNIGDLQDMDMDVEITSNIVDPQGTDIPDADDSQDIDELISESWESLMENAQSIVHPLKPSTSRDLSPEKHNEHYEEEKVSLANILDNYVEFEESYAKAKAEFEASLRLGVFMGRNDDLISLLSVPTWKRAWDSKPVLCPVPLPSGRDKIGMGLELRRERNIPAIFLKRSWTYLWVFFFFFFSLFWTCKN